MKELQDLNIKFNDRNQTPIEILIVVDIAGKLFCGEQYILKCGLVAMKTKLGWILMGKVATPPPDAQKSSNIVALSLLLTTPILTDLWTLDVVGIENPEERKSNQEDELIIFRRQWLDNRMEDTKCQCHRFRDTNHYMITWT